MSARRSREETAAAVRHEIAIYGQRSLTALARDLGYGGKNPAGSLERTLYRAGALDLLAVLLPERQFGAHPGDGEKAMLAALDEWLSANAELRFDVRPSPRGVRILPPLRDRPTQDPGRPRRLPGPRPRRNRMDHNLSQSIATGRKLA